MRSFFGTRCWPGSINTRARDFPAPFSLDSPPAGGEIIQLCLIVKGIPVLEKILLDIYLLSWNVRQSGTGSPPVAGRAVWSCYRWMRPEPSPLASFSTSARVTML